MNTEAILQEVYAGLINILDVSRVSLDDVDCTLETLL